MSYEHGMQWLRPTRGRRGEERPAHRGLVEDVAAVGACREVVQLGLELRGGEAATSVNSKGGTGSSHVQEVANGG